MTRPMTGDPAFSNLSLVTVIAHVDDVAVDRLSEATGVMAQLADDWEVIVVANGLPAGELSHLDALLSELPGLRVIELPRTYDFDTAAFAGLDVAIGDLVCLMDITSDPLAEVPAMFEAARDLDVVQGESENPIRGRLGTNAGRRLFYGYCRRALGIDVPVNATYFVVFSRRAIGTMSRNPTSRRYVRQHARLVGYHYGTHRYQPLVSPRRQRSLRTGVREALGIATNYSMQPLRFVSVVGMIAASLSVLYAIYVFVINLTASEVAQGWTSTSLLLALMFFTLALIMTVMAEYLGRILTSARGGHGYVVADERSSTVEAPIAQRRNTAT